MTTTRHSNFGAALRTGALMATLGAVLVAIGYAIGGIETASLFLVGALFFNLIQFFFSDKIALKASGAKPVTEEEAPRLYQMVRELTTRAGCRCRPCTSSRRRSRMPSRPAAAPRSPPSRSRRACSRR